jgi:hypothetical protein
MSLVGPALGQEAVRDRAVAALVACLLRCLDRPLQPDAEAVDKKTGRYETFALENLRGKEGYIDWERGDFHWPTREAFRAIRARVSDTSSTVAAGNAAAAQASHRGIGGRRPVYDWSAFIREVVRFANFDGFETRAELTDHMREWCLHNWPPDGQPDPETLRRKIKELCPPEIPEK